MCMYVCRRLSVLRLIYKAFQDSNLCILLFIHIGFDPMWNLGPNKRLPPQGCRILASLVSRYAGVLSDVAVVAVRLGM